jgi:cytochrome c5
MRRLLLLMLVLCGCGGRPKIWTGVYSAEQAARGRSVYEDHCTVCHRPDLAGLDGRLKGKRFMEDWLEDNLNSLFIEIKRGMPAENPSSLSDAEYLDVLTYVLSENGFPRGQHELRFETLKNIEIVSRDGPKPLPKGAMIQTFGCLTRDATVGNWTLRNTVAFTRARNFRDLGPEELNQIDQQRPGSRTVDLDTPFYIRITGQDRRFTGPKDLVNYNGRKVMIRGRLESDKGTPRVMILMLQDNGSGCR